MVKLSGVSASEMSLIERGRLNPSERQLGGLATGLGIDPWDLLLRKVALSEIKSDHAEAVTA